MKPFTDQELDVVLSRPPAVDVPEDFARRVAVHANALPRPAVSNRRFFYGRNTLFVGTALLLLAIFVMAAHPETVLSTALQAALTLQLLVFLLWFALGRESLR